MTLKIVGGVLVLVVLLGALYAGKLLFTEDLYVTKGSFGYYVTIRSSNIKNFPLIGVVNQEVYYSSCGDGPKPPANGIRYTSKESPQKLKESIERHLFDRGFVKQADSIEGGDYVNPGSKTSVELTIKPEKDGLQRVIATEYYAS
jgi:hypothetical protein